MNPLFSHPFFELSARGLCHHNNDVYNLIVKLLSEVCHDVQTEPHLHPLTGEILHYKSTVHEDDARVDIRAADFCS